MESLLLYSVFNGLVVGIFYALMALGLSLILGLNGVINFAHGTFMALGGYIAFTIEPYVGFWGSLIVAPLLTVILGLAVERVLIRPLYGRDPLFSLLLTFGLAMIMEDLIRTIWGAVGRPFVLPGYLNAPLSNTFFFLTGYRVVLILITIVVTGALFAVLRYSRIGIRIRAGNADLETISAMGVNIFFLRAANFGIGIFLAGVAGILAAGQLGLSPSIGSSLIMPSFVAIIVGGVGSLVGSVLGGLIIGIASGITAAFFPVAQEVVIYVIMAIVLVIRPRGLLGQEGLFE
ncbi:branched-chain amino acid ABC transporter permease [Acidocella aminolytica]|uniref:ABC transporter amide-urea permease n=1 Tax=Acidocella aminolytica 101 = DSM 11237 TaxID=1120923 RepID=A0A0D6PJ65_9PROT|nr:branched-chain amino acid ABC transporter permease [Acidocella aminolytica]GAN80864.1 ABC transporter amide-urea permease [Acidocella aminolytica 101 = DSM 11237]GBQ34248.1 branched-chain amino acid ABC transporter permease [Acidocella aminolytica 101 = DSM 11237]SHE31422.1 amino acid/amide ABC transporter membrane protein 1, HAAT family [Acidocella aminolytica 101 = DSM 11237]